MDEPLGNDEILKLNILLNSFLQGLTLNDINIELVHTMKVQAGMHADILEGVFNGIVEAIHEADNLEIYTMLLFLIHRIIDKLYKLLLLN